MSHAQYVAKSSLLVPLKLICLISFHQVETVGDKYMAVSGLPLKCERHAHNIANLCLDMQEIAKGIVINGKRVQVRINTRFSFNLASFLREPSARLHLISLLLEILHENNLLR